MLISMDGRGVMKRTFVGLLELHFDALLQCCQASNGRTSHRAGYIEAKRRSEIVVLYSYKIYFHLVRHLDIHVLGGLFQEASLFILIAFFLDVYHRKGGGSYYPRNRVHGKGRDDWEPCGVGLAITCSVADQSATSGTREIVRRIKCAWRPESHSFPSILLYLFLSSPP